MRFQWWQGTLAKELDLQLEAITIQADGIDSIVQDSSVRTAGERRLTVFTVNNAQKERISIGSYVESVKGGRLGARMMIIIERNIYIFSRH